MYNGNYNSDHYCTAIDKIVLDHKDLIYSGARGGQGFSKPPGYGEGYREGRGQGTDFVTLHKPLPMVGVLEGYWRSAVHQVYMMCI